MIGDLKDQIYRFRKILLSDADMARAVDKDHQKMLEAMKARDLDQVERFVKEHILRGQNLVLEQLKQDPEGF